MRLPLPKHFVLTGSLVAFSLFCIPPLLGQQTGNASPTNQLVELLQAKGLLSQAEAARVEHAGSAVQESHKLADLLLSKGLISPVEYARVGAKTDSAPAPEAFDATAGNVGAMKAAVANLQPPANPPALPAPHPSVRPVALAYTKSPQVPPQSTEPGAPAVIEREPSSTVNEALTPVRVFPVGGPRRGAVPPSFKDDGVGFQPYGFIKATAVEDSSSPNGDDFPLPGFLADTGPDGSPEFHLKARSSRFGVNFEWYDPNPKWVITGKVEGDFEGNFNRSDNRNLSSLRSNNPSLRLAWGRLDYHFNDRNIFSALFGQDWTTFGSSTLPNILETTGLAVGDGTLYERDPQMRVGYTHKSGGVSFMPEFAIDLPGSGLPPSAADISNELGYGERQGPDSNRPNYQGRLVTQWQLDHARGVPAAQIIFSAFEGRRTAIVLASAIPANYRATFATGVSTGSKQDGVDAEWQLPTRWFTLVGKVYDGSDLRWFFSGQLYSFFNDTAGLTGTTSVASEDGASNVVLGTNAQGQQVVAPERPVRAAGGFVQLGLPLSRWFDANPAGRDAGWSLYGMYGEDQARERDINRADGVRHASDALIGTLNYRLNRWVSFSYEESLYTTHANPEIALPLFRGVHSREWNDVREEGGPIFFF